MTIDVETLEPYAGSPISALQLVEARARETPRRWCGLRLHWPTADSPDLGLEAAFDSRMELMLLRVSALRSVTPAPGDFYDRANALIAHLDRSTWIVQHRASQLFHRCVYHPPGTRIRNAAGALELHLS